MGVCVCEASYGFVFSCQGNQALCRHPRRSERCTLKEKKNKSDRGRTFLLSRGGRICTLPRAAALLKLVVYNQRHKTFIIDVHHTHTHRTFPPPHFLSFCISQSVFASDSLLHFSHKSAQIHKSTGTIGCCSTQRR